MDVDALLPPLAGVRNLPHRARPRLYLSGSTPLRRWRESAFYPAFKSSARLYRFVLRCKAAIAFPAVNVNPSRSWAVRDFVGDSIPDLCSSVILVGTPGPAQKMTVQLWDNNGVAGYLKYGETLAAQKSLEREHEVLAVLPEGVGPTVMKYGTMADGAALLLGPIEGRPLAAKLPPEKAVIDFLQPSTAAELVTIETHPWVRTIRNHYGQCMDRCLDDLKSRKWPVAIHHGDAAPWNILRISAGKLRAIDWEYGTVKGFPYLDLAHFVLQVSLLIHRRSPGDANKEAVDCLCRNSSPALEPNEGRALVRLAAFQSYMQSQADGHPDHAPFQIWRRLVWEPGR